MRFVVRDVWRGMSARAGFAGRPPRDSGLQRHIAGLALTRWDAARGAQVDNLVLLSHDEADAHDVADLARLRGEEPEFVRWVERRLAIVAAMFGLPADAHMT